MGLYATTTSISLILPGFLKSNTTSADTEGTAIFSAHIDRAEAKINAAVSSRYSLPFSPIPPLLRSLAEDVASFYAIRGSLTQDGKQKNQYMQDFKDANEALKQILEGALKLTYTDGSLVPPLSTARFLSSHENYTPVFGLDDADQWKRDDDEVDAQDSARD